VHTADKAREDEGDSAIIAEKAGQNDGYKMHKSDFPNYI
tara:strand:+ start:2588 stop:2704 length:117 start_codon:yes stop_codon:yes gene_type:complete